jgi:fructose-1,6-bisphosphatase/inositol monophosphatase family enzyme
VDDLELAAALVRDAGDLAARMLADGLTVQHKTSISDVVSAADHAAEELVVGRLRAARPDDGIVGEEGTAEPAAGGRTWFVDPVDGTYNFLAGLPIWCSALACDDTGGTATLGAVYQPATAEMWTSAVGVPTTRNGVPVDELQERPLSEVSVATYLHPGRLPDAALREPLLRVIQGAATVRMLGSGSIELAAVAAGRLGASVQANTLPWDWLPGAALVRGAGGTAEVIEARGQRWHIAANRETAADIAALLQA